MRRGFAVLLMLAASIVSAAEPPPIEQTMALIRAWVQGGYDNSSQAAADVALGVPDELKHRVMHQLFAPAEMPNLPGYTVYQQASVDGSTQPDRIWRNGVLQFIPDPATGTVRQRELSFREPARFQNAQFDTGMLRNLSAEDFKWDEGCDFFLRANSDGTRITGPIGAGTCRLDNPGTQQVMVADDEVVISAGEYWFLGRYVDETGRVIWGNASPEHVKMVRTRPLADVLLPDGGVLIFGATRNTGLELARLLRSRGDTVTAFVRPQSDRRELDSLGVRIVSGDALEPNDVSAAMRAAHYSAVVTTLGCFRCEIPPDYIGNRNVFDAANAAGLRRVIMVSTLGAGDSADVPPFPVRWFLGDAMALKTQAEDHLLSLKLDHTIIRPGALKEASATGSGLLTEDRDALGVITREDLAGLIVDCIDDPDSIGKIYSALDTTMSWPWSML